MKDSDISTEWWMPTVATQPMARFRAWAIRNLVLRAGDTLFRQGMLTRLRFLEQAQWWDAERIEEYRARRLTRLLQTVWEDTPFYRQWMRRSGAHWRDIRVPRDLRRLPAVTKAMLRGAYPEGTVRSTGHRTYPISTSGSSGQNFFLVEDHETAAYHRAALLLALRWAGWHFGEPHLQTGIVRDRNLERRLKDWVLHCHYLPVQDLSEPVLDRALDVLRHQASHLWGYPGALHLLARRAAARSIDLRLQSVVTWGDMLYPRYREAIERSFGARVLDTYGCSEGMQIAAQCPLRDGYHIQALDVIVDCEDDAGEPVQAGQAGHLVVTRLHPGPMPLIRYRIGDQATPSTRPDCDCGRHWPLLENLQGRDTDVILTPSGNRLLVHFFNAALDCLSEIDCYQIRQCEAQTIDILVTVSPGVPDASRLPDRVRARIRECGAGDLTVRVHLVDRIQPTSAGKRRFIVSELALV